MKPDEPYETRVAVEFAISLRECKFALVPSSHTTHPSFVAHLQLHEPAPAPFDPVLMLERYSGAGVTKRTRPGGRICIQW